MGVPRSSQGMTGGAIGGLPAPSQGIAGGVTTSASGITGAGGGAQADHVSASAASVTRRLPESKKEEGTDANRSGSWTARGVYRGASVGASLDRLSVTRTGSVASFVIEISSRR